MVKQEEINGYFLEIIRFLKSEYGYTQEFIVEKAKLGKSAISKIKNGENNVGDKTITKLCGAFGMLNPDFFYGKSPYKTLREKAEAELNHGIKDAQKLVDSFDKPERYQEPTMPSAEVMSIYIEHAVKAATVYADKSIATLEGRLADKDKTIAALEDQVTEKKKRIEYLEKRIADFEAASAFNNENDYWMNIIEKSPFPPGVAEEIKKRMDRV